MKSQPPLLSDKDLQQLKITYRSLTQNYYQNPSQQNITSLQLITKLCTQIISTRQQSDSLLLISILEILKVKSKSHKELNQSIQGLIVHLKNPLKIYIKDQVIRECLDNVGIYGLACIVVTRCYEHEMKIRADCYNWRDIIAKISKGSDRNMVAGLEAIVKVLPDYQNYAKEVNKSGMIKYMCNVYLPQVLDDKACLYRCLKVLKMVAKNDRTVLPGRQKNLALIIYTHPAYILITQQICQSCYDAEYSQKVLSNSKDIDPMYIWSYNTNFCQLASQRTIEQLEKYLVQSGKNIPADLQWKIYSVINNLVKAQNFKIGESWKMPMNAEKNLCAYLKLMISIVEKNPQENFKKVDMKTIDYVYDKSKIPDSLTDKLLKDLKSLDPSTSKKVGRLESSIFQHFSIDKNPQILMQKATKIPKTNQDLRTTQQIININQKNADQLQTDIIKTLKNKSLDSLRSSIVNRYPIDLANLFNGLNLDGNDPEIVNKLIKLGELALTMDPDSAEKYNQKKFLDILEWLENNHGTAIIDWIAVSQMLAIIFGPDQWKSHINQIPKRSFWVLNATNGPQSQKILSTLSSLPPTTPKLPIILGMLSKTGDSEIKKSLLKHSILQQVTSQVCNYKNTSRSSTKTYRGDEEMSDSDKMKKHLINVLNLSYYIYNWSQGGVAKEIEGKIIRPCLENIIKCFQGYQHQYRFVQNCLPFKINVNDLKDINLAKLLETHGRLSSYLYKNKYDGRIDFSKISTIASETDPQKIEQILKFLQQNPDKIQCTDLLALLDLLLRNARRDHKYWRFYPNYMSILNHISDIASKTNNPQIIQKIAQIFERIINGTADNDEITDDQLNQLYQALYNGLDRLLQRKVKIDANSLKREAEKIKDKDWKKKIIDKLKIMSEMNLKVQPTKVSIQSQSATMKQAYVGNKYQTAVNIGDQHKSSNLAGQKLPDIRIQASTISTKPLQSSRLNPQKGQQFEQKKDQNIFQGQMDTNQIIKDEQQLPSQSPQQQALIDALKMLKKIILKQEPKETFPKLYDIFMISQFNKNRRYILGHLLTEYYEIIQKDQRVMQLLEMKDKTNLCKEVCFQFLSKFQEVFKVGKRWKLMGNQFLDLAMERAKCRNQNKIPCVENGCEIAEYNLLKTNDISYFYNKKYHQIVVDLLTKIEHKNQALFYLLLVGTSARLNQIKTFYISNKMHIQLMDYTSRLDWLQDKRIAANLSYALSSLVYTQNHIAIEVCSRKNEMLKLLAAYRHFATVKSVVESGCSLLSNICYSNKQTKQLLYQYGTNQILVEIFMKNIGVPEVSTYKQIMRTLGNISLHKPSSEKLISMHVCQYIVTLAQKLNILIFRDDQKLKVLKLIVDFFSNLASHKTNLQTIHSEGVTNFVITILQTTQISEDHVLMACIDTIDGLCQNQQIQNYVVMDKKMLLQLIDLLKIKQDQKLITKSIRLLTNMTLNQVCIPYILQANLLSVLGNIVLPVYHNQKIDTYINKVILRIFARKPDMKLVLKSGYLDCLMKALEVSHTVDDGYIDILLHYCQFIPNYLNHRAFFNLVKILTTKQNNKDIVEKCFKVIRVIFTSEQRQDDDINIEGSSIMYQKLLQNPQISKTDVIYLIGLHCTKSRKFKVQLQADHIAKKSNTLDQIHKIVQDQQSKQLAASVMFTVLNKGRKLVDVGPQIAKEEDFAYRTLSKGFQCKLFRMDGSSKNAVVDINEMYMIRAYKYPDGQIKKKYVISIRQLRDWQFLFEPNDDAWKNSVFMKQKGVFETKPKIQNCVTLLGSQQWGQFSLINLQFNDTQTKISFCKAISALVLSFKV